MKKLPSPQAVIVGAGPVGLLLANLLGQAGVRVLIIEKRIGIKKWSRSIGITPPSLAILNQLGLDKKFIKEGLTIRQVSLFGSRSRLARVVCKNLPRPYPYILSIPQYQTQSILLDSLKYLKTVTFMEGIEMLGFEDHRNGILLKLYDRCSYQSLDVNTEYVIGCDGENSKVREQAGIKTVEKSYLERFIMADLLDQSGFGKEAKIYFTLHGAVESFPLPGHKRRWIVQCQHDLGENEIDYFLERIRSATGLWLNHKHVKGRQSFKPHKMMASSYFLKNVILCGDAAHVMSPIGGQGMNTGFADAWELSKRFTSILQEREDPQGHFEIYQQRRRRAANKATRLAELGMWLGTRIGWFDHGARMLVMAAMAHSPLKNYLFRRFAMLKIPHGPDLAPR